MNCKSIREFIHMKGMDKPKPVPTERQTSSDSDLYEKYKALFRTIDIPTVANENSFLRDDIFGWYRVAGPNPMQLHLVKAGDATGPLEPFLRDGLRENFSSLRGFSNDSIDLAISEKRLFLCDYSDLAPLCDGSLPGAASDKLLYAPAALFCVPKVPEGGNAPPLPIAIIEGDVISYSNSDEDEWQVAKMKVQVADAYTHETVHHFGRTHLLMEAFVCATHRTLDPYHPVMRLLAPHFEGTAFINSTSLTDLLDDGGTIDVLTAPPISDTRVFAVNAIGNDFSFDQEMPDVSIPAR